MLEIEKAPKEECLKCGKMLYKTTIYKHVKNGCSKPRKIDWTLIMYMYTQLWVVGEAGRLIEVKRSQKFTRAKKEENQCGGVGRIMINEIHYSYQRILLSLWNRWIHSSSQNFFSTNKLKALQLLAFKKPSTNLLQKENGEFFCQIFCQMEQKWQLFVGLKSSRDRLVMWNRKLLGWQCVLKIQTNQPQEYLLMYSDEADWERLLFPWNTQLILVLYLLPV